MQKSCFGSSGSSDTPMRRRRKFAKKKGACWGGMSVRISRIQMRGERGRDLVILGRLGRKVLGQIGGRHNPPHPRRRRRLRSADAPAPLVTTLPVCWAGTRPQAPAHWIPAHWMTLGLCRQSSGAPGLSNRGGQSQLPTHSCLPFSAADCCLPSGCQSGAAEEVHSCSCRHRVPVSPAPQWEVWDWFGTRGAGASEESS